MYSSNLGPSLRQRFDRSKITVQRNNSADRFSSFQSPPPSDHQLQADHQLQEFSDYDTPNKEEGNQGRVQSKKQKSYILVQQLPLQLRSSSKKNQQVASNNLRGVNSIEQKNEALKETQPVRYSTEGRERKQNSQSKYRYMEKVQKQLSAIKQDAREYLRQSCYNAHLSMPIPFHIPLPRIDPYQDHFQFQADHRVVSRVQFQEQRLIVQQLRLKNALLEQQNIGLRDKIYYKKRSTEFRRASEICAEKIAQASQQEQFITTRKQVKQKLLEEIAALQGRCREMKEQMNAYKLKQETLFDRLFTEKEEERKQNLTLRITNDYHRKFVQVFLNMIEKLPIEMETKWPEKKKIAVGWRVIKHFVKKALKLGIQPPTIAQRQEL